MADPDHFLGEELHHYFRNVCLEFKKAVKTETDINELEWQLERFINAAKDMKWQNKSTEGWRKSEGEKASQKVMNEFKRYIDALQTDKKKANPQDLLQAIAEIEQLIRSAKVL